MTVATLALCGLVPASASAAASFTQAWGWGVLDGQSQFESCTSSCQAGISGGGGGQLANPFGVAIDSAGNVYVADYNNNRVSSFSSSGAFLETWGWGVSDGLSQFETCTSSCQSGVAGNGAGQFHEPIGIAVDASGDVYVTDYYNNRVEEFTSSGGYIGQFGTAYGPEGISTDSSGNIYVALSGQHRIDKYTATGSFIETWGWGVNDGQNQFETCTRGYAIYTCDQGLPGGGAGQMRNPYSVATDSGGNVYVADLGNSRIDEFSSSGNFIKAWGWGVSDGQSQLETCTSSCQAGLNGGGAGEMSTPKWVAADSSGDIYVSDYANHRIEHFTSAGSFVEAWGWGVADGQSMFETCTNSCEPGLYGAGAGELALPEGLAADSSNDVYVADFDLNRIDQFAGSSASAASITSANTTRFTVGTAGSFTVTASGYPTPSLSESGPLPTGVSFHDNGDGNATLSGTPASGTGGSYPLTITAHNGVGSDATQSFTLTVDQPAAITSASTTRFTVGTADSFTVTASGYPTPSLSESGTLPTGVSFHDDGDASATISGTPSRKAVGTYNLTLMAKNGIGADATQSFTLVVAKKKK